MIINIFFAPSNLPNEIPLYCLRCRSQLFRVNREVVAVWTGEGYPARFIARGTGWIQIKCHSCKGIYNFYIN